MAPPAHNSVRRLFGNHRLMETMAKQVLAHPTEPPIIDPSRLGSRHYGVDTSRQSAGALVVTSLRATFPSDRDSGLPRRLAWLLAGRTDLLDETSKVLAIVTRPGPRQVMKNVTLRLQDDGIYQVGATLLHASGRERLAWSLRLTPEGIECINGTPFTSDEALVASALEFIRRVGDGDGFASAIYVMNTAYSLEYEGTAQSLAAIPEDLAPLVGPLQAIAARHQADRFHAAHPLIKIIAPSDGLSETNRSALSAIEARMGQVYLSKEYGDILWDGTPIDRTRYYRLLAEIPDAEARRTMSDQYTANRLARLGGEGGLFESIDELNRIAREAGHIDYAELSYRRHFRIDTATFHRAVSEYAAHTLDDRLALLGQLKQISPVQENSQGRLLETDVDSLLQALIQQQVPNIEAMTLTLVQTLKIIRRFFADLGFNLERDPELAGLEYDLVARVGKMGNSLFAGVTAKEGLMSSGMDPDRITLAQLKDLVHEHYHWLQFRLGAVNMGGAIHAIDKTVTHWKEGSAKVFGCLIFAEGWMARYVAPETGWDRAELETYSQIQRSWMAYDDLRLAGRALQEISLYRARTVSEALHFWNGYRNDILQVDGSDSRQAGEVWAVPHFAIYPGQVGGYFYGIPIGNRQVAPITAALAVEDSIEIRAAGKKLRSVLNGGPWMTSDDNIDAVFTLAGL